MDKEKIDYILSNRGIISILDESLDIEAYQSVFKYILNCVRNQLSSNLDTLLNTPVKALYIEYKDYKTSKYSPDRLAIHVSEKEIDVLNIYNDFQFADYFGLDPMSQLNQFDQFILNYKHQKNVNLKLIIFSYLYGRSAISPAQLSAHCSIHKIPNLKIQILNRTLSYSLIKNN